MKKRVFLVPMIAVAALAATTGLIAAPKGKSAAHMHPSDPLPHATAKISNGTYFVESTHALIGWRLNHFNFNDYFGIFGNPTGTLTLDKDKPADSKVVIDIPLKELYTASSKLEEHISGPDFFDVAKFPSARFESSSVSAIGTKATIIGNLTLHGVTKPVTLFAKFSGAGLNAFTKKETVGFQATAKIKRSDWGISQGVPMVGDNVDLDISVAFEKN
jgi:polyisoprenoid-binding protein YceI